MVMRTRFAGDIVTEFLPPLNKRSKKVLILAQGMPSIPKKKKVMELFAAQGYWVFFPRYRGTWESGGKFLAKSPHLDILDVVDGIQKEFTEFFEGKTFKFKPSAIHLLGTSFGGAAVLLAAQDKRVDKVVALSPVIDWRVDSVTEPLDWFGQFVKNAFGDAFRFSQKDWNKLGSKSFYNPIDKVKDIPGKKVMIFHAKDDLVVPYEPSAKFVELSGSKLHSLKKGGHLSTSLLLKAKFRNKVLDFLS